MSYPTFKREPPQTSLNAPNIKFRRLMTNTRLIPWEWNIDQMFKVVPRNTRHLVFCCHGFLERPNFKTPHLSIGTTISKWNVDKFQQLFSETLKVIWVSGCNLGQDPGKPFLMDMAYYSGAYVVNQLFGAPDLPFPSGQTEDNVSCTPVYVDPYGTLLSRPEFISKADDLGFAIV